MTTTDELKYQLTRLGESDVVGPRREFVAALGQQLESMSIVDYAEPVRPTPRRRARPIVFAPAFAALLLIVGGLIVRFDRGSTAYALSDPVNVTVEFGDGHSVVAVDGMKLAKGATVFVGAGGSVRIGTNVYTDGSTVVIGDHGPTLQSSIDIAGAVTTATEPKTTVRTVESTKPPVTVTTTNPEPAPTTKPEPPRTTVAEPPATTRAESTTTKPVESTRPTTTVPPVASMDLVASRVETSSQIALSWSAVDGTAKYALLCTTATGDGTPAEPSSYPAVAPTTVSALTTSRTYTDVAEAPITRVRYRVVALNSSGKVIGSSTFVDVPMPR